MEKCRYIGFSINSPKIICKILILQEKRVKLYSKGSKLRQKGTKQCGILQYSKLLHWLYITRISVLNQYKSSWSEDKKIKFSHFQVKLAETNLAFHVFIESKLMHFPISIILSIISQINFFDNFADYLIKTNISTASASASA